MIVREKEKAKMQKVFCNQFSVLKAKLQKNHFCNFLPNRKNRSSLKLPSASTVVVVAAVAVVVVVNDVTIDVYVSLKMNQTLPLNHLFS